MVYGWKMAMMLVWESIILNLGWTISNDDDDDNDDDKINTASSSSLAGTLCIEASDDTQQIEDAPASLDDYDEKIAVQKQMLKKNIGISIR